MPEACAGVTLIELLVVSAIFALLSSVIFATYVSTTKYFSYATRSASQQADLGGAMNAILEDISDAGWVPDGAVTGLPASALPTLPSGTGCFSTSDSFTFIGDVAPLGDSNRVTYQVDASNDLTRSLQTWSGGAWTPGSPQPVAVAANVSCFKVAVEDSIQTPISTNLQNARYVVISLATTDSHVKGGAPLGKQLSGTVALRNFIPTPTPASTTTPTVTGTPAATSTPAPTATPNPTPTDTPCGKKNGKC